VTVAIVASKVNPNHQIQIQEARSYYAINQNILQNTAMAIVPVQYDPTSMIIQMRTLLHLKLHVKVVVLVQNTVKDINKGMQMRIM
jgi:hypothetical protein